MPKRPYDKPQIKQHELSQVKKAWALLQEALKLRHQWPEFFRQVLWLAKYAADISMGMPSVEGPIDPDAAQCPPPSPNYIRHAAGLLGEVGARLAGINSTCAGILGLLRDGDMEEAQRRLEECLRELGLDTGKGAGV